jgi:lipopolysaccharide transport system ATP-binding protein
MGTISVRNLGKAYKRYPNRWSRLIEWMTPFGKPRHKLNWVLEKINFDIKAGESIGIIGTNGAGKSTLLKMISGTSQPNSGEIQITGRVAALLELGMGFHPDFTGRQNVFMAGQLLGYGVDEISSLMSKIEAFAEIGEYIDQPVRFYSSGMQMRLAFSVATAHRPDILIVDEALSVGDAYFQHKCFDRIREFREQGTTLLIVSHDKMAIQSICDRAILLNGGGIALEGKPEEVMDYYNALIADRENQTVRQEALESGKVQTISGSGECQIDSIALLANQKETDVIQVGQAVSLRVKIRCEKDVNSLVFGYMIKDRVGQSVFGTNTHHLGKEILNLKAGDQVDLTLNFTANLGPGTYSLAAALHAHDSHLSKNYEWRDHALVFSVINTNQDHFLGVNWLPPEIEIRR